MHVEVYTLTKPCCIVYYFIVLKGFEMEKKSRQTVSQTTFLCQCCEDQPRELKCMGCDLFMCQSCVERVHAILKIADQHMVVYINHIKKVMPTFAINYVNKTWFLCSETKKICSICILQIAYCREHFIYCIVF